MIEIKRKPNESVEAMLRRFSEILQKERVLDIARESRFRKEKTSRRQNRKLAISRKKFWERKKYLKKIGALK